ncbi:MAG: hypothetical protein HKM07_06630 [Chlamydiae bacterium]|nr:hypothetical protein [Chlamydiota bacterium]
MGAIVSGTATVAALTYGVATAVSGYKEWQGCKKELEKVQGQVLAIKADISQKNLVNGNKSQTSTSAVETFANERVSKAESDVKAAEQRAKITSVACFIITMLAGIATACTGGIPSIIGGVLLAKAGLIGAIVSPFVTFEDMEQFIATVEWNLLPPV